MRRNKTTVIIVMCVAILFMAVGYALLSTRLDISGSTAVTSTWKVEFSAIRTVSTTGGATNKIAPTASGTTANFEVDLILPGDEITYEIDITNYGDIAAEVQSATYSITGSEAIYVYIDGIKKGTLIGSCEGLDTCPTVTLVLKIGYKSDVIKDPTDKTKDIEITIKVGQYVENNPTEEGDLIPELKGPVNLVTQILSDNNGGFSDKENSTYVNNTTPGIDFSAVSSDTNGKGLYYTNTNTEDNKTTYYFRGDVNNNFVKFGAYPAGTTVNGTTYSEETPMYWRIIRINEDGSIRMIYNGTSTTAAFSDVTIGDSAFNENDYDNAHVGYMYGLTGQSGTNAYKLTHANDNPSTIKTFIDNWYTNSTNLSSYRETHLADAGFCNDRSLYSGNGYGKEYTFYRSSYLPGTDYFDGTILPQFACPNVDNDLFTTSMSTKGNKALSVPIGLITADEFVYSGTIANMITYLCVRSTPNSVGNYNCGTTMTMSPFWYDGDMEYGSFYYNGLDVRLSGGALVRPVINLKADTKIILEGTGTNGSSTNPYIVQVD